MVNEVPKTIKIINNRKLPEIKEITLYSKSILHSLNTLYELASLKFKHIFFFSSLDMFLGIQISLKISNLVISSVKLIVSLPH